MFKALAQRVKENPFTLVFTEGNDLRILEAASKIKKEELLKTILIGDIDEIKEVATTNNLDIEGIEIINPLKYDKFDEMVELLFELRKGKMDKNQCIEACKKGNYFGTMLVKMGYADGLLGGATYSTADTVRPALQIVKTAPGNRIVSSCFIMVKDDTKYAVADCAINVKPTEDELVDITFQTVNTARVFDIDPKVAMLSYSTLGSGKGEDVDKMRNATQKIIDKNPDFGIVGEIQFDAAISPTVAKVKAKDNPIAGYCNTFIFPDINAGNIGYKLGQRLGGYEAMGPILQGLAAPINDLSRGCTAEEVYKMALITAAMK
ncbi:MAG: phosphate acetyltransferase [Erysipelotrichaceae bacterium]|nr:phosphate acetyltransferase [Erysipelotrichaceae bacterium]